MKKRIWACCIALLCFLTACGQEQIVSPVPRVSGAPTGETLVPEETVRVTATHNVGGLRGTKEFDSAEISPQLRELLADGLGGPLTAEDVLSMEGSKAADITITCDTGQSLYLYADGVLEVQTPQKDGSADIGYYYMPPDRIHQIMKLLFPEYENSYYYINKDWEGMEVLPDICGEAVEETPVFLPAHRALYPWGDNVLAFETIWNESQYDTLRALAYDGQGQLLWMREYSDLAAKGLENVFALADGGFIISSYEILYSGDRGVHWLEQYNDNGERLWRQEIDAEICGSIQGVFETSDGQILIVGTDDAAQNVMLLCNGEGTLLQKAVFPFTSSVLFAYLPGEGLLMCGNVRTGNYIQYTLLHYDEALQYQWAYVLEEGRMPSLLCGGGGSIYVAGILGYTGTIQTFLFRLDYNGQLQENTVFEKYIKDMLPLADGGLCMVTSEFSDAYGNTPIAFDVLLLNEQLEQTEQTDRLMLQAEDDVRLYPAADGGFFAVFDRTMGGVSVSVLRNTLQPDSAKVLCRYDGTGKLLYRKTYDRSSETEAEDTVLPLPNGRVVVNRLK